MKHKVLKTVLLAVLSLLLVAVSYRYWLPTAIGVILSWQGPIRDARVGTIHVTRAGVDVSSLWLELGSGSGVRQARIEGIHIRWGQSGSAWLPRLEDIQMARVSLAMAQAAPGNFHLGVSDVVGLLAQPGRIAGKLPLRSVHIQRLMIDGARVAESEPVGELSLRRKKRQLWAQLRMNAGAGRGVDIVLVATPEQLAVNIARAGVAGLMMEQSLVSDALDGELVADLPALAKLLQPWCGAVAAIAPVCAGTRYASWMPGRITGSWKIEGRARTELNLTAQIQLPMAVSTAGFELKGTPVLRLDYQSGGRIQASLRGGFKASQSLLEASLPADFDAQLDVHGHWSDSLNRGDLAGRIRLTGLGKDATAIEASSESLRIDGSRIGGTVKLDLRMAMVKRGPALIRDLHAVLAATVGGSMENPSISGTGWVAAKSLGNGRQEIAGLRIDFTPRLEDGGLSASYVASATRPHLSIQGTLNASAASQMATFKWYSSTLPAQQLELRASAPGVWPALLDLRRGRVELSGRFSRSSGSGKPHLKARVEVEDTGGVYATSLFDGLNIKAGLDYDGENFHLATEAFSVEKVTSGVALTQVHGKIGYTADISHGLGRGTLRVDRVSGSVMGGKFEIPPFQFAPDKMPMELQVKLAGVSLSGLLGLQGAGDLHGEGTLDATLPLTISEHGVRIAEGRLQARAPGGVIQYRPKQAPAFLVGQASTRMILDALHDYAYRQLSSTVSMQTDGTLKLGVRIKGIARDLDHGRAVNFSFNLEDNLYDQLVSLQLAGKLDDVIEKRLRQGYRQGKY